MHLLHIICFLSLSSFCLSLFQSLFLSLSSFCLFLFLCLCFCLCLSLSLSLSPLSLTHTRTHTHTHTHTYTHTRTRAHTRMRAHTHARSHTHTHTPHTHTHAHAHTHTHTHTHVHTHIHAHKMHIPDKANNVHCSGLYKQACNKGQSIAPHIIGENKHTPHQVICFIKKVTSYIKHHENTVQIITNPSNYLICTVFYDD